MRANRADSWTQRTGRSLTVLVPAVAIGGIVAFALFVYTGTRPKGSELRRLAEAVGPHRVTLARLTGGFAYAPCDTTASPGDSLVAGLQCSGAQPTEWDQAGALSRFASRMHAGASGADSVSERHAWGAWHIVWSEPEKAVEELQAAAQLDPANAGIQSDLSAALLARAERAQDPRWILDAYEASDSAVTLEARLPEARFNQAVALEWLSLRDDAITAWASYLELDNHSSWANEARDRLRVLRARPPAWQSARVTLGAAVAMGNDTIVRGIAGQFPVRVREEVRLATLGWARSHQAGAPRSDTLLRRARMLASALAAATGDSLWFDAVHAVIASTNKGESARLDAAARGFIAYDAGQAYLDRLKGDSASPWLREAERALTAADNAARYLAAYGLAQVAYLDSPSARALTALRHVRTMTPNAYRGVRGRAARTEGVVRGIEAGFDAAIAAYVDAIREGAGTGDPALELQPHANIAFNYANLGAEQEAWRQLYAGLRSFGRYTDAEQQARLVFIVAAQLSWRRAPGAASLFQREAVRLASLAIASRTDSLALVSALERQAELFGRAGQLDQAFQSLDRARAYLQRIQPDSVTASFAADMDLVQGSLWLGVRPDSAVRVLRRVVARYKNTGYLLETDRALLLLANAYTEAGDTDSARSAFLGAIAETERRRSTILRPEDRARFLDRARPVIDRIVTHYVDHGDTLDALEFLESMRGRVLLERIGDERPNAIPTDRTVDAVRSALPPRTNIVSYAVLDRELIAWLIRRDGVWMRRIPDAAGLGRLVSRFSMLIATQSSGPEIRAVAAELHRRLIAPFAPQLEAGSRLIFVPDKWLHFVPFGALFDATKGAFVVETFETGMVPSLRLYARMVVRYRQLQTAAPPAMLAVGDPAFNPRLFSLPRLRGARDEAKQVASLYANAHLLIGDQATKQAFIRQATMSDLVHFAGHGVVRPDVPLLSYLVLASDRGVETSEVLTARDLFGMSLPRARLVILSGCHTASGQLSDTEGVSSLARALFAAGVPAVVASLWAVDDTATPDFFASFHRRISQGEDPTTALRRTQVEWLTRTTDPWRDLSTWAAFALYGATSDGAVDGKRISVKSREAAFTHRIIN